MPSKPALAPFPPQLSGRPSLQRCPHRHMRACMNPQCSQRRRPPGTRPAAARAPCRRAPPLRLDQGGKPAVQNRGGCPACSAGPPPLRGGCAGTRARRRAWHLHRGAGAGAARRGSKHHSVAYHSESKQVWACVERCLLADAAMPTIALCTVTVCIAPAHPARDVARQQARGTTAAHSGCLPLTCCRRRQA